MATPQSSLQSYIQSQAGTQTTAQSAVPSAVNNGNPNTVYNTNPWQQQFNALYPNQQAIPPMTTADGKWFMPQQTQPLVSWQAPQGQTIHRQVVQWPNPDWSLTPLTGGSGGGGAGGTGGGGNGGRGGGLGGTDVMLPPPTQGGGNYTPGQPGWESLLHNAGIDPGPPGSEGWNRASQWSQSVMSRMYGAKNSDGSWDWRQIADMISEPLIGGNLWLSGSNKWDVSNGIAGLVEAFTGIPVNALMNKLGEWQATQDDPADTWLEKMLADHWEDNANNDIRIFQDTLTNYLGNYADYRVNNLNNMNSNANQNWLNNYTNALSQAMLQGLKGQAASDYARNVANQAPRDTTNHSSGGAGGGAAGGGGGGRDLGYGVNEVDVGCVVVDNIIDGYDFAGDVEVGDEMKVADPLTGERHTATVSQAKQVLQPCVRLTTKRGVVLECSRSAEIADEEGNRVLAEDLLGVAVPVMIDDEKLDDVVMKVEDIGSKPVMKITCENSWYLAGKKKGRYLFHHNVKYFNEYGNRTTASGWQGSGSITPNGLLWGW